MTYKEAQQEADRMRDMGYAAKPVRILPSEIDPIRKGDNGWDVEVTVLSP